MAVEGDWPSRVVVAPDSFKGSASSPQVARAITRGMASVLPWAHFEQVPMADGGEGTAEAVVEAAAGRWVEAVVTGPLGEPVKARLGLVDGGQTAVVEMAQASGLTLVPPHRRDPRVTTTYGTGQLIRVALDRGVRRIVVALGGSATVDGGAGMARALGARFLDEHGHELGPGGGDLVRLARVDVSGLDPRLARCEVLAACDVFNPLTGPEGAASVYGPQKGASPEAVQLLEQGLKRLAAVLKRDLGVSVEHLPGAGAAGGLGAGLVAFCGARLESGVELVMRAVRLRERLAGAHLVVTGEGQLDRQTPYGKTVAGVGRLARELNIPAVALCGSLAAGVDSQVLSACGLVGAVACVSRPMTLEQAVAGTLEMLEEAAQRLACLALGLARAGCWGVRQPAG